ncbi:hypothetical protein RCH18_000603 [Flavobacterium sp. PL11]|nr:hypothetical protein [Flavobacterium sp. PL11]
MMILIKKNHALASFHFIKSIYNLLKFYLSWLYGLSFTKKTFII